MITVTMINEKGGVGKTTCSLTIAAGLAVQGARVLVIDADAQGHATVGLGLAPEPGLYNLLVRDAEFNNVIRVVSPERYEPPSTSAQGTLAIVPGNTETMHIANAISDAFAVHERMKELTESFDVVIFDTAPTPSLLHGSIFIATDAVIYPTELEYFSLKGLESSINHVGKFSQQRRTMGLGGTQNLGIIPTKFRENTAEHDENLKALQRKYGALVWDPMPLRITWAEAAMQRRPIFSYEPKSRAAKDGWQLVESVSGALVNYAQ